MLKHEKFNSLHQRGSSGTFFGHPTGLFVLFFAELWERFSYYGMRALLILYLTKHFLMNDSQAYSIYGGYTSLVFVTPVIGGYLADRYLGARRAVLAGGVMISVGHILIAASEGFVDGFFLGLATIVVGTGLLKANISVLVGQLYVDQDTRRDSAFSIFYMGINIGGFTGPILCGILGETLGWAWGFGAAGMGMLLGLLVFIFLGHHIKDAGSSPSPTLLQTKNAMGISFELTIYLGMVAGVGACFWLLHNQEGVGALVLGCAALSITYILYQAIFTLPRRDRDKILGALFLIALAPLFWALLELSGSSLSLYTDRHVDRTLLGWTIPTSLFQATNPIFIVILAPVFAALWTKLSARGLHLETTTKFGAGLILLGSAFFVLIGGATIAGEGPTPVIWIILLYLFFTMGELCFAPVGLSAMTFLSTARLAGLIMGTWFLGNAAGNFAAGQIAQMISDGGKGAGPVLRSYGILGGSAIVLGLAILLVSPYVSRLTQSEVKE